MPLETLLISGPPGGGKSVLARLVAFHAIDRRAHYLRMVLASDDHTNAIVPAGADGSSPLGDGWSSIHEVTYTPERVFEILPEGLRAVRKLDRFGFAIVEADGDPALRHAYPYDYRIFVMPPPRDMLEVFRDPAEAAQALQQVMEDTASFASEIFGLFDADGLDDSMGVHHCKPAPLGRSGQRVERLDIRESQLREFLSSPLGVEIASRIQLQPGFHAMVESDVVVINTGARGGIANLRDCVKRIEKLLARVRHDTRRHSVLYWGDIADAHDPTRDRLLRRLRTLFVPDS